MTKIKNVTRESGFSNPLVLAAAAIAICSSLAMGAVALKPATAGSANYLAAGNGSTGYFPDQFINQAKSIEALPDTYGAEAYTVPAETQTRDQAIDSTPEMYS